MRRNGSFWFRDLRRVKWCVGFATIAVALSGSVAPVAEPVPAVGRGARQPHEPCLVFVEATLAEMRARAPAPPRDERFVWAVTEYVFRDARRLGTGRRPEGLVGSEAIEMTCHGFTDPSPELLEPGDHVVLYTTPGFPGTWLSDFSVWYLAADTDCEDPRSGDFPMVCSPAGRWKRDQDAPQRGMAMPGGKTRPSILCSDRGPVPVGVGGLSTDETRQLQRPVRRRAPVATPHRTTTASVRRPGVIARPSSDPLPSSRDPRAKESAQGDFNEDGKPDLAVASAQNTTVQLRLGDGQGQFLYAGEIIVGKMPTAIGAGDVDRDGHVDLVIARSADGAVIVFLGNGEAKFEQASMVNLVRSACAVTIGDFDGGPSPDVAVAHCGPPGSSRDALTILVGDGAGNLDLAPSSGQQTPVTVAIADVNDDGTADILTLSPAGTVLEIFSSDVP